MEEKGYYQGVANRIRIDMDSRSPRLRLSVLGILLENGVTPEAMGGIDEWGEFFRDVLTVVGGGLDEFADEIQGFEEDEPDTDVKDAYDILKKSDGNGTSSRDGYM